LRLVAARQLRVGGGLLEALRTRLRRLSHARARAEGQLRVVPLHDSGAASRVANGSDGRVNRASPATVAGALRRAERREGCPTNRVRRLPAASARRRQGGGCPPRG